MRKSSLRVLGYCLSIPLCIVAACPQHALAADGSRNKFHFQKPVAGPIAGKVTDPAGQPLPGVTITVKGTHKTVTSDVSGVFVINANKGDVLVLSSVGYATQQVTVGDEPTVSVHLVTSNSELSSVVVTALGIKKQARAIGYSTTEVDGSKLTESREPNLGNALTGQVAGVNVAGTATGPSGSSRVVIRGNASISQNDQPLYVIDGIPFDNTNQGMTGQYGGVDYGDGLSTVNPDDIESIQVLKGVAASALYGYRGGNGAILITTKSGSRSKGIGLTVNNNTTLSNVIDDRDYQYQYGQGIQGLKPDSAKAAQAAEYYSWGAPIDGSQAVNFLGNSVKYSAYGKDNFKNFYKTGPVSQTSVALSGSNDQGHFRLGISDLYNGTPIPNSNMKQQGINFNSTYNVVPKLQVNITANYVFEQVKNRVSFSDAPGNVVASTLYLANTTDIRTLKPGTTSTGAELLPGTDTYFNNPYFVADKFQNSTSRQRFTGSLNLKYSFTDWLSLQSTVSRDGYIFDLTNIVPSGTGYDAGGQMTVATVDYHELNANYLINFNKKWGDFSVNANAGGNYQDDVNSSSGVTGAGPFLSPNIYSLNNIANHPYSVGYSHYRVNSLYGNVDLGYKNFLFLNATARNDWFSTLSATNNHDLYPSVSGSFVFSDAVTLPSWISFGKLRASYAGGSNGTTPYLNTLEYSNLPYTINGQTPGYVLSNSVPDKNLTPVHITERELGVNAQFLNNRVGFDLAWYDKTTSQDIVNVTISPTAAYNSYVQNIGKMRNDGLELLLTGTPVTSRNFTWNVSFNIAQNNNKVLALGPSGQPIVIAGAFARWGNGVNISDFIGKPFAQITGFGYKRDAHGNKIFSDGSDGVPAGEPEPTATQVALGSGVYKTTGGFSNDFHYKSWTLSVLVDFKYGAKIYSGSNLLMYFYGLQKTTLQGRANGGYVGKGVDLQGHPNTTAVNAETYWTDISNGADDIAEEFVYNASFIKLRSASLTYNFSGLLKTSWIKGATVSLVARNLATLMKHTPNIDPEANYSNGNGQGLELSGYPAVRTTGLNVNLKF